MALRRSHFQCGKCEGRRSQSSAARTPSLALPPCWARKEFCVVVWAALLTFVCMLRYSEWNVVPIWFLYSSVLIVVRCADLVPVFFDTYRNIPISIEEYRDQIGTAYHYKYRRIQKPDRHNVPFWVPQHTDKSQQRSPHNNAELLPCPTGWEREGGRSGCGTLRSPSLALTALKMRPA